MAQKTTTKEALLNTAIRLFQQNGFSNVTVNDICKDINVTKTAFYYNYKSKDELIYDYFSANNLLSNDELTSILCAKDYANQIMRVMEIRVKHIVDAGVQLAGELYRVSMRGKMDPILTDKTGLSDILETLIKHAQESGQIKNSAPAHVLNHTLCYLSNGIVMNWIMMHGDFDVVEESMRQYKALLY